MTVASETRAAVREHPFVYDALRAGILNYTAAARFLDVGETEAVGAALRRYADELEAYDPAATRASVSMQSGVAEVKRESGTETGTSAESTANPLFQVGGTAFTADGGEYTAITATGGVDASALGSILGRLRTAEIEAVAGAAIEGTAIVVVERRAGADAVRAVESAL